MPHRFVAEVANVKAKTFVSISDSGNSDWNIFNPISTYHTREVTGRWVANHSVGLLGIIGVSDLSVGKPF